MTTNSNPFLNPELLNPKLTSDLTDAFEKNKAKGLAKGSLGSVAVSSLADIVKTDTKSNKDQSIHSGLDLDYIGAEDFLTNPEKMQQTFETAFANTEKLFARIDLIPPTPEQFTKAGVDFLNLASEFERMEKEGLEPAIVISPTLRLKKTEDNPDLVNWRGLYDILTKDKSIQDNPLTESFYGCGIDLGIGILTNSKNFFRQEIDLVTKNENIHHITKPDNNLIWTIALTPSTNEPQELGTLHANYDLKTDPNHSQHMTISQYLTLQASRIQSRHKPLDRYTRTWLEGTIENGSIVAYGGWNGLDLSGQVGIYCYKVDNDRETAIGVRLPVWG